MFAFLPARLRCTSVEGLVGRALEGRWKPSASTILLRILEAGPNVTTRIFPAANSRAMASASVLLVRLGLLGLGFAGEHGRRVGTG